MSKLTPIETLYGEVFAMQIVMQRLVAQEALRSGFDFQLVLRAEHGQASAELSTMNVIADQPDSSAAILAHAQSVLDQIYSVASTTRTTG